jgi:Zn-dependent peptidase ImmA (M78 family)
MAQRGKAVLFIDGEDEPAEQRYSLAHEGGHYLIDHRFPRDELLEQFGDSILDVLNGLRQPALTERVDAVLNRSTLTTMTHLLERESGVARMMAEAESQADALAIEALAPTAAVLRFLPALKDHPGEAVRVRQVLQSEFAVPSDIAEFYAPRICVTCGRPIDFRARFGLELA